MSDKTKITGIRLNIWEVLALIVIVYFFWEPLLIIGGILLGGWLICRNQDKIGRFFQKLSGK